MSIEGCARKNPLTPPLTNMEMNPMQNNDALLIRRFDPYRLPSQINVMMVAGIVITKRWERKDQRGERIHAAEEHVMSPHHVAEKPDSHHAVDERFVA